MKPAIRSLVCGAGLASLLLVFGCVPVGRELPEVEDSQFSARGIETVALQPIVFRGGAFERPTTYCERDIPNRLRYHLGRFLELKGYRVKRIDRPPLPHTGLPDPLAVETPVNILEQTPVAADAVLVVWVDRYDQMGLCEHVRSKGLEIGATAALYSTRQKTEIWRNSAHLSDYSTGDPVVWVTYQVPRKLLSVLPDVP